MKASPPSDHRFLIFSLPRPVAKEVRGRWGGWGPCPHAHDLGGVDFGVLTVNAGLGKVSSIGPNFLGSGVFWGMACSMVQVQLERMFIIKSLWSLRGDQPVMIIVLQK